MPGDLYRYNDAEQPLVKMAVNGRPVAVEPVKGYVSIRRIRRGNVIALRFFPCPCGAVAAHPAVKADVGRFAGQHGPLVYFTEGADNDGRVLDKVPGAVVSFETVAKPDMLGGIVAIRMTSREKGLP